MMKNTANEMRYKGFTFYRIGLSWYMVSPLSSTIYAGNTKVQVKDFINAALSGWGMWRFQFGME